MDAKEYLKSIGIELEKTTLIVNIDGANRQPDLCLLMEDFAKQKVKNITESLMTFGIVLPNVNDN
jgi:hypothetical protein